MKLFLERLKTVGINVLTVVIGIALAVLLLWGLFHIPDHALNILNAIAKVFIIVLFGGMGLFAVGYFIHWLFIEPFRRKK